MKTEKDLPDMADLFCVQKSKIPRKCAVKAYMRICYFFAGKKFATQRKKVLL